MTPKTIEALQRLHTNVDFQEFLKHLESECETATAQLVNATENEIRVAQGRVQTFNHVIGSIKHVQK
jgi:hypothetical protein